MSGIWASSNYGIDWALIEAKSEKWNGLILDSSGKYLTSITENAGVYVSTSSGNSWSITSLPNAQWTRAASSNSGSLLVATAYSNGIFVSGFPTKPGKF